MYKKMTFKDFLNHLTSEQIETFKANVPFEIRLEIASDPDYVVRVDPEHGVVEFGYDSDVWIIK